MQKFHLLAACLSAGLLAACGSAPPSGSKTETIAQASRQGSARGGEVVLYAMSLIDTGYRFGGKNPEAGLDCSGMVSYIYRQSAGVVVQGSAADIARQSRVVAPADIVPGDLVFFNTLNRPFSHVGIYIGDRRFIHAPSSKGKVRIERLDHPYFASRFEAVHRLID
ncbi:MAG: C40 family peptidase [Azonexus sp.]|nr:C40 family peptidase [Azonexus sp.]